MATRNTLKGYFDTGDTITETNLDALIDSGFNLTDDTLDNVPDGTTYKLYSATEKSKLAAIEASADVTDAGNVGSSIHGATAKTTMVDADKVAIIDTEASNVLKTLSWAYVKSILKTYFDSLYTTVAGFTTTGSITLGENTSVALDPAGSADGKYSGITVAGTGGATIAFGDLVTLDKDDSRWELVDISAAAAATGDARGVLGIAVTSSSDGNPITVLLHGIVRADANFPTLTIGAPVYASTTGDIVVTQPTTTDHVIRIVGYAMTADELYFNPGNSWTTHT